MSSFGRDLVAAANCGTSNPLVAVAQQISQFQNVGVGDTKIQQSQIAQIQQLQPHTEHLVQQFQSMQLQQQQQQHFEKAFQQPQTSLRQLQTPLQQNHIWVNEFHQTAQNFTQLISPQTRQTLQLHQSQFPHPHPHQLIHSLPLHRPLPPMLHTMHMPQFSEITQQSEINQTAAEIHKETNQQTEFVQETPMSAGLDKATLDKLLNSDNSKWRNSKFLKFIDRIQKCEIEFRDNQIFERQPKPEWATELSADGDIEKWNDEYKRDHQDNMPYAAHDKVAQQWADEFANSELNHLDFNVDQWANSFDHIQRPDPTYTFSENPYLNQQIDHFALGKEHFAAGRLREAIQYLEAAVQKDSNHAEAWCLLGRAKAENESESEAIAALLKAVELDPYNLQALMTLGVSYTNDLEETRALSMLKTWILQNPDYGVDPSVK